MLLIVIALLWVALLAPMALRRLRDRGTERSIESFHTEHEVLSRQGYAVAPAHRLSEPEPAPARASRLTVVHADDTYRSLESRSSWDEWSEDYDYDRYEGPAAPVNRYAQRLRVGPALRGVRAAPRARAACAAQRARPAAPHLHVARRRGRRDDRRRVRAVVVDRRLDVAIVAWVALAGYVSLALYAVSPGLPRRVVARAQAPGRAPWPPSSRSTATPRPRTARPTSTTTTSRPTRRGVEGRLATPWGRIGSSLRGCSSTGRALRSQRRVGGFESASPPLSRCHRYSGHPRNYRLTLAGSSADRWFLRARAW